MTDNSNAEKAWEEYNAQVTFRTTGSERASFIIAYEARDAEVAALETVIENVRALVMSTDGDYLDGSSFDGLAGEIQSALRKGDTNA